MSMTENGLTKYYGECDGWKRLFHSSSLQSALQRMLMIALKDGVDDEQGIPPTVEMAEKLNRLKDANTIVTLTQSGWGGNREDTIERSVREIVAHL